MPPILSSIITLMWPDLLTILVIIAGLAIPFLALNALLNRIFGKRGAKASPSRSDEKEERR